MTLGQRDDLFTKHISPWTPLTTQIGRQMVTTGKRFTPKETERYIDAVTPDDIKRVAQKYLWDKDVSGAQGFRGNVKIRLGGMMLTSTVRSCCRW